MKDEVREYIALLSSDEKGSDRFWKLEERIRVDQKSPGVIVHMSRSSMNNVILDLLIDRVITLEDLSDFSEELQDWMSFLMEGR